MGYRKPVHHKPHLRDLAFREAGDLTSSRRGRSLDHARSFRPFDLEKLPRSRIITVKSYLPIAVAHRARNKIYAYPHPLQVQKQGRVVRTPLVVRSSKMVPVRVRIRVPTRLPLVRGSYVSIDRGRLNVHSRKQVARVLQAGEFNRRRYNEFKRHHRYASHGQLDSPGAVAFGSVAHTAALGGSINRVADAALVARAVLKGGV